MHAVEMALEGIDVRRPEAAVLVDPGGGVFEGAGVEAAGPPLRFATARDQAGAFQHLEVFGDGRHRHLEGPGEFGHRSLAEREPAQDGAARGIGKGGECGAQLILHGEQNQSVK